MYSKVFEEIFLEIRKSNIQTERTQNVPGKLNVCERITEFIIKLLNSKSKRKFFMYLVDKKKQVTRRKCSLALESPQQNLMTEVNDQWLQSSEFKKF